MEPAAAARGALSMHPPLRDATRLAMLLVAVGVATVGVAACGGARGPGDVPRKVAGKRALADPGMMLLTQPSREAAPVIRSLPPLATYAWIRPGTAFQGLQPHEDVESGAAVADVQETATAVLRANGWREAAPDSAQYHLTMARAEFHGERFVVRHDPRNERRPPQVCPGGRSNRLENCREPAPPNYPPIRVLETYTRVNYGYAITRVADGAWRWWVIDLSPEDTDRFVARRTVELLLAVEKEP